MVSFETIISKFDQQGEKSGWTYIEIPSEIAQQIKAGNKKSFRVKGKLDHCQIKQVALLPTGAGDFIMPLNAEIRKLIGKKPGAILLAQLEEDKSPFILNAALMKCLADEPEALKFFKKLPDSHQRYFSKWIDGAKTEGTKIKRLAQAVNALAAKMGYAEMIRAESGENKMGNKGIRK